MLDLLLLELILYIPHSKTIRVNMESTSNVEPYLYGWGGVGKVSGGISVLGPITKIKKNQGFYNLGKIICSKTCNIAATCSSRVYPRYLSHNFEQVTVLLQVLEKFDFFSPNFGSGLDHI